jgi:hypothetical protein
MARRGENGWSRREFLRGPTLAGTAIILGLKSESGAAEARCLLRVPYLRPPNTRSTAFMTGTLKFFSSEQ